MQSKALLGKCAMRQVIGFQGEYFLKDRRSGCFSGYFGGSEDFFISL
jgi:hypothetical protein